MASPSIQDDLDAGFDQIQFIGAAYVIAFGALLITGRPARRPDRAPPEPVDEPVEAAVPPTATTARRS